MGKWYGVVTVAIPRAPYDPWYDEAEQWLRENTRERFRIRIVHYGVTFDMTYWRQFASTSPNWVASTPQFSARFKSEQDAMAFMLRFSNEGVELHKEWPKRGVTRTRAMQTGSHARPPPAGRRRKGSR